MTDPAGESFSSGIARRDHVKRAAEVDRDDRVPLLARVLIDRRGRSGDAGVVDQHVETAERRATLSRVRFVQDEARRQWFDPPMTIRSHP